MNTKVAAIAAAAVVAVAGGGYLIADRVADARAQTVLEDLAASLGTGEQLTWSGVDAEPFGRGVTVRGLTYQRADGYQARIASLRAEGLTPEGGAETADLTDVVMTLPDAGVVTIGGIAATAVAPLPDIPDQADDAEAVAHLLGGLGVGTLVLTQVEARPDDRSVSMTAKTLTFADVAAGRYGRVTLEGAALAATDGTAMSLQRLAVAGLDLGGIGRMDEDALQVAAGNAFGITELGLTELSLTGPTVSFGVGGVTVDGIERVDGVLVSSNTRIDHVTLPASVVADENPVAGAMLQALGRDTVDLSVEAVQRFDADSGALTLGPLRVRSEGMGEAVLQADLRDVPLVELAAALDADDFAAAEAMAGRISLVGASLTYTDDRLADVLIDDLSGGDRQGFADMAAAMVAMEAQEAVSAEDAAMVAEAVRAFLVGGNAFSITLQPTAPVLLPVALAALQMGQGSAALALKVEGR
ncbi:hypothetical protein [Caenispirillum bisanense]|uniref:Uncharacterized protein n=1 Tax=Caenispirillum bisanense TaxID=414052 RepID=A0A286GQZ4_9PROT|nr:hypothetical protein [Caenispirillum bisanense]SOD97922.1 hypothetical protein SAMN05421508_107128 [Caenispirillum bisanense]